VQLSQGKLEVNQHGTVRSVNKPHANPRAFFTGVFASAGAQCRRTVRLRDPTCSRPHIRDYTLRMAYWIGTSGYNYPEWRGTFYPEKFPAAKMLAYYAERFNTVEINYTFYRMPNEKQLAGWAATVPESFAFTLKAPRRITHDAKLQHAEEQVAAFCAVARTLGSRLGVLLFQLPPTFKRDIAVLEQFLACLPAGTHAAFEFRHPSWHDDDVYDCLRRRNVALCIADSEKLSTPAVVTADYGYFRLRDEGYQPDDISAWGNTIRELSRRWTDAFVYFKHEEQGIGPAFAARLREHLSQTP
jgi:uncharacterized protein YecE (DUF72 family)